MRGWLAVSVLVASAPMETPPPAARLISVSLSRLRSTSSVGRSTSSFIRSSRFVPPARNLACGLASRAAAAAPVSVTRVYLNGRIAVLLSCSGQLLLVGEAPGVLRALARMDFLDGGNDPGVRPAATDVAAHALADLVVREPGGAGTHILGHVTDVA